MSTGELYIGDMDGLGITLAINALKAIAFVCDILTFPFYLLLQRPWKTRALSRKIKAIIVAAETDDPKCDVSIDIDGKSYTNNNQGHQQLPPPPPPKVSKEAVPISKDTKSITYRSVAKAGDVHVEILRENVDTLAKVFNYVSKKYANKRCLGTREIKAEEDELQPNGRVFKKYDLGDYIWKTFAEVYVLATNFGKGLRELGNSPKKSIVIFAESREEWMIAAQGLFQQNIPVVTIYATLGDDAIAHGINETEVTTVITSFSLMPKFKNILHKTPNVSTVIYMEDQLKKLDHNGYKENVEIFKFSEVIQKGSTSKIENNPPRTDDIAIIMYTSGSTGVPKGVILLHCNLISTLKQFCDAVKIYHTDVLIGFLPLAHVFELLVESLCLLVGVPIGYSSALTMLDSSSKIKKGTKGDASVLQPTCMTSVPLILDRISKGIQEKVSKSSPIAKAVFKFAYDYKLRWIRRGYQTPLIDRLIFRKVRELVGGRVRLVVSGGAPLSPDTHEQIKVCLCVQVIQGYGLTETTSCAVVMDSDDMSVGRAGAPTTLCDVKLVNWDEGNYRISDKPYPRGEVVIGGDHVSPGYYKLPEKTKDDFFEADGKRWFKTGDICEMHEDGSMKIIDRKKDLVKLQAGEYVSLGKVETELKTCPIVDNICVYGDSSKHYCVALVVPNQSHLIELAAKVGITEKSFEELCSLPEMEKAVLKELEEHGRKCKLEKFEIPAAVKLVKEVWSPDMGLVTAAFKLKRKDIQERYQHEINRMYAS
ncbi:long-chain-fatty-acid--CoA ligase 4 isoform X2 [Agrilus planipennis]|uniref:long-chain-fatty-acid--CoA ligase n=1 Tax=Agrilus planipennis TaxID=224129 RepID=A0A1W4WVM0_AGRPL|nr:long-chain-fatty-acid--CoA ligase 4 isoform X2 [Agrilus planipennis]